MMKRPIKFWVLIIMLVTSAGFWFYQDRHYPHPIYEYYVSDEWVETDPTGLGRTGGYPLEKRIVWEPDNPALVEIWRDYCAIWFIALIGPIFYVDHQYRLKRNQRRRKFHRFIQLGEDRYAVNEVSIEGLDWSEPTDAALLQEIERMIREWDDNWSKSEQPSD